MSGPAFTNYETAAAELNDLAEQMADQISVDDFPLIVLCDDPDFCALDLNNFVWTTFTRSNPSHDIYGVRSSQRFKHWGCEGPLIIDARLKPHHAPPLIEDPQVSEKVDRMFAPGGVLENYGSHP